MRPTVKLGEIVTILNGRAYSQNELLSKGKYPVLRVGNFFTNSNWYYSDLELEDDKYCNNGDLLYAWSASFGPKIWEGGKTIYHYHIWKIKLSDKIDKHYLYHYLYWDSENIKRNGHGVAMMHVTKGDMERKEIPLPTLETQKAIVAKLDQIFAELDQTKSEIQKNLDNTDELWKSALNQAFQGDWEMKKLGEVAEIQNGGTPKTEKKEYWDGDILWITPKDMGELNSKYVEDTSRKISKLGLNNSSAKLLPMNSVILSSRAPIGYVAINTKPISTNQGCKGIIPNDNLKAEYLYYFLILSNKLLNSLGSGATFKELSSSKLGEVKLPVPSISEQEKIVEHLDQVSKEVKALKSQYQSQLDNLEELKKSVLDKAFKGELGE